MNPVLNKWQPWRLHPYWSCRCRVLSSRQRVVPAPREPGYLAALHWCQAGCLQKNQVSLRVPRPQIYKRCQGTVQKLRYQEEGWNVSRESWAWTGAGWLMSDVCKCGVVNTESQARQSGGLFLQVVSFVLVVRDPQRHVEPPDSPPAGRLLLHVLFSVRRGNWWESFPYFTQKGL